MKKTLIAAILIKAALARFTYGQEAATILTDFAIRLDGGNAVASGGSSGTVTSADMTVPTGFTISGGPITTTGTFALGLSNTTASYAWMGPTNGSAAAAPAFRLIRPDDLIAGCSDGNIFTQASASTFTCVAPPSAATDLIFDAKGDLAVGTANNTAVKLTVGANDKFLVADSTQTTGLGYRVLKPADLVSGCSDGNFFTQLSAAAFTCVAPPAMATDPLWDAKGDLAGGTGNNTAVKLTVGANDTALVADSAQTTGMKWQTHTLNLDTLGGTRGMTLVRGASTWAGVAKGTNGQIWKSDGTDPAWHDLIEPGSYYSVIDDFIGTQSGITTAGSDIGAWTVTNAGTGGLQADALTLVDGNHPGVLNMSTFAGTTGATTMQKYSAGFLVSGGEVYETLVYLNRVSDGTDTYITRIGLCSATTAVACPNGLYFEYTHSVNSGDWTITSAQSSTRTATDSAITVTAAAWHKLKIVVNAAATSVQFFVDGVSAGTITTNLPTGSTRLTGMEYQIVKSAGTTPCILAIDYVLLRKPLTR